MLRSGITLSDRHEKSCHKLPWLDSNDQGHLTSTDDESRPLIIDIGSWDSRVGLAGDRHPRRQTRTVVGRFPGDRTKRVFVGDDAYSRRGILRLRHDCEDSELQALMRNLSGKDVADPEGSFVETPLNGDEVPLHLPQNVPLLMSESLGQAKQPSQREQRAEIALESLGRPSFGLYSRPLLSLYATGGSMTGMVVHCGSQGVSVACVENGLVVQHSSPEEFWFGGSMLTQLLMQLLGRRGYAFSTTAEQAIIKDMKERHCFVSFDYDEEMLYATAPASPLDSQKSYELPDGQVITFTTELFQCPEALFKPSLMGSKKSGLPFHLASVAAEANSDLRPHLLSNIVLCGGTSQIPGFADRLQRELRSDSISFSERDSIFVRSYDSNNMAFVGLSMLGSSSSTAVLTRAIYDEEGPSAIHRVCPVNDLSGLSNTTNIKAARTG